MTGDVIDCSVCKRRYMRNVVPESEAALGEFRCRCGQVLGQWYGSCRLDFDPEDPD